LTILDTLVPIIPAAV